MCIETMISSLLAHQHDEIQQILPTTIIIIIVSKKKKKKKKKFLKEKQTSL